MTRNDFIRLETSAETPAFAARWIGMADDDASSHAYIKVKTKAAEEYFFTVLGGLMADHNFDDPEEADAVAWLEAHGVKY